MRLLRCETYISAGRIKEAQLILIENHSHGEGVRKINVSIFRYLIENHQTSKQKRTSMIGCCMIKWTIINWRSPKYQLMAMGLN